MRRERIVAAIALALLIENALTGPALRDPAATLLDLLPDGVVEAAYEAIARGLHLAAAAVAVVLLVTAVVMMAASRYRQFSNTGAQALHARADMVCDADRGWRMSACEPFHSLPHRAGMRRSAEIRGAALHSGPGQE
jgi:hypothetical protein